MSSSNETNTPFESKFPELRVPVGGWQSNIPTHLLENCDGQTLWLMQEMSKNTQATEFACRGVEKISDHLRQLNGQVNKSALKIAQSETDLKALKEEAETMSAVRKTVLAFLRLWEYRAFRWTIYAAAFFFFTYLLPEYLRNPWSAGKLLEVMFGP